MSFDSETLAWSKVGITVYGSVRGMVIDKDGFLILQVAASYPFKKQTFYRFPLKWVFFDNLKLIFDFRSPDTLRKLSLLTIRRYAMLFGGNSYKDIVERSLYPLFVNGNN